MTIAVLVPWQAHSGGDVLAYAVMAATVLLFVVAAMSRRDALEWLVIGRSWWRAIALALFLAISATVHAGDGDIVIPHPCVGVCPYLHPDDSWSDWFSYWLNSCDQCPNIPPAEAE